MVIAGWAGIVLALCALAQAMCVRRDRQRFPPPGRIVNGRHVRQVGSRGPAVAFEAGIGASSSNWGIVQAELATSARTFSYDRPGLGWSAPARGRCSLRTLTDDLHELIRAADVPRPVVLTGHSFGTYIARVYAHRFPEDVIGLVLVDPVTPEEWLNPDWRSRARLRNALIFAHAASVLATIGVVRLGLWGLLRRGQGKAGPVLGLSGELRRIAGEVAKLPPDLVPLLRARWSEPRFFTTLAEYIRSLPACAAEAARHPIPAGLPVTVFSGAHQPPDLLAAHRQLATRHVVVEGSSHWIHLDQPHLVADAIRAMAAGSETMPHGRDAGDASDETPDPSGSALGR
jgi:pimeloyl-ACP methyl ester carboxylesterase